MKSMLEGVRDSLRQTMMKQKSELGFNLAGLKVLGRRINDISESAYVDARELDNVEQNVRDHGKKRAFVNIA